MTAAAVYHAYTSVIEGCHKDVEATGRDSNPLPSFSVFDLTDLVQTAIPFFRKCPNVLSLTGDFYVVGDLHGNIRDLVRLISAGGPPSTTKYLFLGDYVDRGEYSVEVITLLIAMALEFPDNVFLIRGNHELPEVNSVYGFKEQLMCLYGSSSLYASFQELFAALPVAAILNDDSFCVHGGLSPELSKVSDLMEIDREVSPIPRILNDIMWSDPVRSKNVEFLDSERGKGCKYGPIAVTDFLNKNGLKRIIRAHQFTPDGAFAYFDGKLMSVFSTCNYKGEGSNNACVLRVKKGADDVEVFKLVSISVLKRADTVFVRKSQHERASLAILRGTSRIVFTKPILEGGNKFCKPVKSPFVRGLMTGESVGRSVSASALSKMVSQKTMMPIARHSSCLGISMLPALKDTLDVPLDSMSNGRQLIFD